MIVTFYDALEREKSGALNSGAELHTTRTEQAPGRGDRVYLYLVDGRRIQGQVIQVDWYSLGDDNGFRVEVGLAPLDWRPPVLDRKAKRRRE